MIRKSGQEVTSLLREWSGGNRAALDKLIPLVHDELHRLAHQYMLQENKGHILQTTALVNEAYLRLVSAKEIEWKDRAHFFRHFCHIMRHMPGRLRPVPRYQKRSGRIRKLSLNEALLRSTELDPDFIKDR